MEEAEGARHGDPAAGSRLPIGERKESGEIVGWGRKVVLGSSLEALGVAMPGPVPFSTLRCWLASGQAAGLDWLAQ